MRDVVKTFTKTLRWALPALFLFLGACAGSPEETEKARGVFKGVPLVLAMSVMFIVLALAIIGGALVIDRAVRTRKALPEEPEPEPEETDEVVAGITVGRAPVPRWLYGAYVLIPIFAMVYVFSNVAVAPATVTATPKPTPSGPCDKCTIEAKQIKFSTNKLTVKAGSSVSVAFTNADSGIPHTFTVWPSEAAAGKGTPLGDTGTFGSGTKTATFKAPAKGGSLYFDCIVHPTSMFGTIDAE